MKDYQASAKAYSQFLFFPILQTDFFVEELFLQLMAVFFASNFSRAYTIAAEIGQAAVDLKLEFK